MVAWMTQDMKKQLTPGIREVLKRYGMKGTISVRDGRVLVVNLKSGPINFIGEYVGQFPSDYFNLSGNSDNVFVGKSASFLSELLDAMNIGNWDRSDVMTDYFVIGWHTNINVGKWNAPYQYIPEL